MNRNVFNKNCNKVIVELSAKVKELESQYKNSDDELETENLGVKYVSSFGMLQGAKYLHDCLLNVYKVENSQLKAYQSELHHYREQLMNSQHFDCDESYFVNKINELEKKIAELKKREKGEN